MRPRHRVLVAVLAVLTLTACVDKYAATWVRTGDTSARGTPNTEVRVVDARVLRDPTVWRVPTGCSHTCVAVVLDTSFPVGSEVPITVAGDLGTYETTALVIESSEEQSRLLARYGPRFGGTVDIEVAVTGRPAVALDVPVVQTVPNAPSWIGIGLAVLLVVAAGLVLRWVSRAKQGLVRPEHRFAAPVGRWRQSWPAFRSGQRRAAVWWAEAAGMLILGALGSLLATEIGLMVLIVTVSVVIGMVLAFIGVLAARRAAGREARALGHEPLSN